MITPGEPHPSNFEYPLLKEVKRRKYSAADLVIPPEYNIGNCEYFAARVPTYSREQDRRPVEDERHIARSRDEVEKPEQAEVKDYSRYADILKLVRVTPNPQPVPQQYDCGEYNEPLYPGQEMKSTDDMTVDYAAHKVAPQGKTGDSAQGTDMAPLGCGLQRMRLFERQLSGTRHARLLVYELLYTLT